MSRRGTPALGRVIRACARRNPRQPQFEGKGVASFHANRLRHHPKRLAPPEPKQAPPVGQSTPGVCWEGPRSRPRHTQWRVLFMYVVRWQKIPADLDVRGGASSGDMGNI